eukprot:g9613.t1
MRGAVMFRLVGVALGLLVAGVSAAKPNVVRVQVISKLDEELGVYWINTWSKGALVKQKEEPIVARGSLNVDSYFGHSFLVVEDKHTEGLTHYDASVWDPKIMVMFTMGEFDLEVTVDRDENGNLVHTMESALTRTGRLMEAASKKCREDPEVVKAAAKLKGLAAAEGSCTISSASDSPQDYMSPEFSECLTKAIAEDLAKKESEANKSMRMLEVVGDRARNYTCADPEMDTTNTSLSKMNWLDPEGGLTYNAQVFLDEPAAKLYLLDDFATDAECKALMDGASPHLQDATVNGGAGKSTLSQARRAKAGGVPADLNNEKSVTAPLYRRGYAFANHVTGYNLDMTGQEGFSVIKYGSDDEYRPHCDGDCTGAEFRQGGRVATMVIYCEQAKVGGGTTFSSSDVFINGRKGQAAFFSYLGPDNRTDNGRTRHSGCPILEGTKWIATLWMRRGVDGVKGWQYYDPSGQPSAFALSQGKGELSAKETAKVKAQDSAVDGNQPDSTSPADGSDTVALNRGKEDPNANDSSAGASGGASGASQEGVLSGIAGDARQRRGGRGLGIVRDHDGGIGVEGGVGEGEERLGVDVESAQRLLASADCTDAVSNAGTMVLYIAGVVYCFLGLAIVCDEYFQTSLEIISEVLGLTPDVAGATFLAAGSSAPELFTSLADAFGNANSTGTGTIVGSAMFNILVIVALSAAVAGTGGGSIHIDWRPVCRDILFYSYSIGILGLVFINSEVQWWEGLIMFLSYGVYIAFMKYNTRILSHCQAPKIGITDDQQTAAAAAGADVAAAVAAVSGVKRPSLVGPTAAPSGGGEDTAKVTPLPQDIAAVATQGGDGAVGAVEADDAAAAAAAGAASGQRKSFTLGIRNRVERRLSGAGMSLGDEQRPLVGADQNQAIADEESGGAATAAAAAAAVSATGQPADGAGGATSGAAEERADGEKGCMPGEAGVGGQEKKEEEEEEEEEEESRFAWPEKSVDQVLFVIGLPMLAILYITVPDSGKPKWRHLYVVSFIMSLLWIGVLTHYMVVWVNSVGCFLEVSPIFMGLVVLAIGTSVPDALGSMIAARSGEANMAIANAVGSNVFDVLIGLGFPWFLRGLVYLEPMPVDRDGIALNVIILFCTAILFVSVLALNDWSMNTRTGIFLFCVYIAYVIFVVLRELVL